MKYAEEIAKEIEERGSIKIPDNCYASDGFDKWMYEEEKGAGRMRLIDADNIDFVILEDSLNRIEHKKGDEVDCVIGANEVKAIPIEKLEKAREKMTHYHDGFVMFGRNDLAYAVDNCIKMLNKALEE